MQCRAIRRIHPITYKSNTLHYFNYNKKSKELNPFVATATKTSFHDNLNVKSVRVLFSVFTYDYGIPATSQLTRQR